jgi:hypothetical protein
MTPRIKLAGSLALVVMASTAVALVCLHKIQRLGQPGVRLVAHQVLQDNGAVIGTNSIPLPEDVPGYESKEQPIAKVVSDWLPKDTTYAQRVYRAADQFWIQVNVVLMGSDRTSIHKPEYCLAGQGFRTAKVERDTVRVAEPHPYDLPVLKMTVRREVATPDGGHAQQSALYVYWFVADQQITSEHGDRMWWLARDLITKGVLQRWAYISCFSPCLPGKEDDAYGRMREWIAQAVPQFQLATLPGSTLAQNP